MRKIFTFVIALFALAVAGVHAQTVTVPVGTTYAVALNWTPPSSCSGCAYNVYRVPGTVTITGGTTTGATLVVSGTLGTTCPTGVTSGNICYLDASVPNGATYTYAVETELNGVNSVPSNSFAIAVPLPPAAPTGLGGSAGSAH